MKDWVRYIQVQGKIKNFDSFQKAILNSILINSDIIDNKVYARFKPFIKNYDKDSYKDLDVKVVTATNICIGKCKLITNSEEYDYFDVEIEID